MKHLKRLYNIAGLFLRLFQISKDPRNTSAAIGVADFLYRLGLMESETQLALSRTVDAEVVRNRKFISNVDLRTLATYPVGTLGAAYAEHMISNGLDVDFYTKLDVVDDQTFIMMRLRQTHDLWHVVTGFDVSVHGEIKLQAFMSAQMHSPLAPFLLGGILIKTGLENSRESAEILKSIALGWRMGQQARSLFGVDWDSWWKAGLTELRKELLIEIENEVEGQGRSTEQNPTLQFLVESSSNSNDLSHLTH